MERERVICVSLTEAEWKAFVERHPEPVEWLRRQIRTQLPSTEPPAQTAAPSGARRAEQRR
jgi:hypothetical protein